MVLSGFSAEVCWFDMISVKRPMAYEATGANTIINQKRTLSCAGISRCRCRLFCGAHISYKVNQTAKNWQSYPQILHGEWWDINSKG